MTLTEAEEKIVDITERLVNKIKRIKQLEAILEEHQIEFPDHQDYAFTKK